ncbi:MAG: hypothetical protein M1830_001585 [Pleopsidium flavum]|nr:MAG: hypothetical protein M1830_001585 [Pleopsidium flavum]
MPVSEVCQQLLGRFSGDGAYNPLAAISSGFSGTHEADDDDFGDIKYLYICWKPVDLFDQTVVKVYVGPKKTRFFIHKELLCDHSEFFRAALTGGFKEAHEGAVYLPEDELEVFAKLVEWLYADQLDTTFIFREDPDESVCATDLKKVTLFVKLWVLADRLRIPALQRVAVWAVRSFMEVYLYLPTDIVLYIFENTVPSAEFGKLCVDLVEYMMAKRDKRYASLPDNPVLRFVSRARYLLLCDEFQAE